MRSRTAAALVAAVLISTGAASCGDEDGPDAGSRESRSGAQMGDAGSPRGTKESGQGSAQDRRQGAPGGSARKGGDGSRDASARFTPRPHEDSGGGSERFRVKGGDNSVQDFGGEADSTDFEQVAAVLHRFFDARSQRAWAAACESLAASVVKTLEEVSAGADGAGAGSCAAGLAATTSPAALDELREEARVADVGSVRVEGERGFVIYEGQDDIIYTFALIREGGEWKLTSLAGFPLS